MLDEGTAGLTDLWAGNIVSHRGAVIAEGVDALPGPLQQPRIPLWFGTARTAGRPIRRAARYDGILPLGADAAAVARIADAVAQTRGSCEGFDIAVAVRPGDDLEGLRAAGVTWALHAFWPGHRPDQVQRVIARGVSG